MKTISWIGSRGQTIELKARYAERFKEKTVDLDGHRFDSGTEKIIDADLELWIDGKKKESCWNVNFWRLIDFKDGAKKIWGLKIAMTQEQSVLVDAFLKEVIETGKIKEKSTEEIEEIEEAKEIAKGNERVEEIKATAIKTCEKQVICEFMVGCNDPKEECNMDRVTVWAMPDGTTTKTRQHTW